MTRSKPAPKGPHLPTPAELDALFATPVAFERWLAKQRPEHIFQYPPILYFVQDVFRWGPVLETAYEPYPPRVGVPEYPVASYIMFANRLAYKASSLAEYVVSSELPDWVRAFVEEYRKLMRSTGTSTAQVRAAYATAKGAD